MSGTLTENRMDVVEGRFGDVVYSQSTFKSCFDSNVAVEQQMNYGVKIVIAEHIAVNRSAYLVKKKSLHSDIVGDCEETGSDHVSVVGNKTEGALMMMIEKWGFPYEPLHACIFDENRGDLLFSFNSDKKRSTAVIHRDDGSVRLFCKGMTCSGYSSFNIMIDTFLSKVRLNGCFKIVLCIWTSMATVSQ